MEDQRRQAAEREAAACRATDAQVLEDAERLIAAWNERQAKRMVFERHIVWPDGEIEGVTPKALPPPASHVLPGSDRRVSNSDDSDDKSDT